MLIFMGAVYWYQGLQEVWQFSLQPGYLVSFGLSFGASGAGSA